MNGGTRAVIRFGLIVGVAASLPAESRWDLAGEWVSAADVDLLQVSASRRFGWPSFIGSNLKIGRGCRESLTNAPIRAGLVVVPVSGGSICAPAGIWSFSPARGRMKWLRATKLILKDSGADEPR